MVDTVDLKLIRILQENPRASYAEIARILGGTTDAARRAAADGIKKLRQNYPGPSTEGAPS